MACLLERVTGEQIVKVVRGSGPRTSGAVEIIPCPVPSESCRFLSSAYSSSRGVTENVARLVEHELGDPRLLPPAGSAASNDTQMQRSAVKWFLLSFDHKQ